MKRPPYTYKRPPKGKQLEVIEEHWHEPVWAFLCRPGTGKSKLSIDHAAMQYMAGIIDGLIVIAPNGVHRQWIDEMLPLDLPSSVPWTGGYYSSSFGKQRLAKLERSLFGGNGDMGLRVLAITPEGLQTKNGWRLAQALVIGRRCMVVNDESHRWANTKAAGFRAAFRLTRQGTTKRIATGTLLRQNPFAAYGQFELMGDSLLGFSSLASFKSMYAEMLPSTHGLVRKIASDFKNKTGRSITPQIQARGPDDRPIYRNLGDLRKRLATYSSFLTLEEVSGKEPTVITSSRYVEMTPTQRGLYDQLLINGFTKHDGAMLSADHVFTLSTRLAQIVGGFVPNDDRPTATAIPDGNPKLDELQEWVREVGAEEKIIVWAKYKAEIAAVSKALRAEYGDESVVEYHGGVPDTQRSHNKLAFVERPLVRFFIGNQKAGGTGLDGLQSVSKYMAFYSNDYSYLDREQAVARLARTAGSPVVNVVDFIMLDTIDAEIVSCMQTAQDVHDSVLRRGLGPW